MQLKHLLYSLFWLAFVGPALAEDAAPATGTKLVEIEWESDPEAVSYEIQLSPLPRGKALKFQSTSAQLSEQVPFGRYGLRIRSKSKNGTFSPWSESAEIDVVAKVLELLDPPDQSELYTEGDGKPTVELKWTPVEKAKRYTLKIWSEVSKEKPTTFTVTTTNKRLKLIPGRTYFWQVTFESAGRVDYFQEPKIFSFTLNGKPLLAPSMLDPKTLSWKPSPGARAYWGKLFYRHLDEENWTLVKEDQVEKPQWPQTKLKPGAYKLELIATAPRRSNSEKAVLQFIVKPPWKDLEGQMAALSGVPK